MTKRKFTPPTEFPAEYVDGKGNKAVILGRDPHEVFPFIGYDANCAASTWTALGAYSKRGESEEDLHDIPKRITTWHNVYSDWVGPQCITRSDADRADEVRGGGRLCVYRIERDEDGSILGLFKEEV